LHRLHALLLIFFVSFSICDSHFLICWRRQCIQVYVPRIPRSHNALGNLSPQFLGVALELMPSMLSVCSRCLTALSLGWRYAAAIEAACNALLKHFCTSSIGALFLAASDHLGVVVVSSNDTEAY
jgi:hypothetical protein